MAKIRNKGPKFYFYYRNGTRFRVFPPVHVQGGASWAFCRTTERAKSGPYAGKFTAFTCKYDTEFDEWDMVKEVGREARWRARDQAYRWYCKKTGKKFRSLHKKKAMSEYQRLCWLMRRALKKRRGDHEEQDEKESEVDQQEDLESTDDSDE